MIKLRVKNRLRNTITKSLKSAGGGAPMLVVGGGISTSDKRSVFILIVPSVSMSKQGAMSFRKKAYAELDANLDSAALSGNVWMRTYSVGEKGTSH